MNQDATPHTGFFRCLFCGSTQVSISPTAWHCAGCDHHYLVTEGIPLLVRDWQQHERDLDRARQVSPEWYLHEQPPEVTSPWRHHLRKRRQYVEAAIQQYLQKKEARHAATLLDLGCGDGNHLAYLQPYTEALFGSDYNLVRLARAQARHPTATLFLADILDYPARDNFFEVIFFNHVLEHIPDDEGALANIRRILKPGGLLVLGTPNEGVWWWQLAYRLQPRVRRSSDHVHFYTAETLTQKLTNQGLTVLEVRHMGWGPPHWSLDGRIRRYKWMDDLFEALGRALIPGQASSLYVLATKA